MTTTSGRPRTECEPLASPRARRTHEDIHAAALRLARTTPVEDITADMIAAEAGVSRRTFFNHFPSKSHAFIPDLAVSSPEAIDRFCRGDLPDLLDAVEDLLLDRAERIEPAFVRFTDSLDFATLPTDIRLRLLHALHDVERQARSACARRFGVDENDPKAIMTARLITACDHTAFDLRIRQHEATIASAVRTAVATLRTSLGH